MKKLLALFVTILLSSCVSFTSSNTPKTDFKDLEVTNKPTVLSSIYIYPTINGVADSEKEIELRMKLGNLLNASFNNSNLFGEVSNNIPNPDYKVEVVVNNNYTECKYCHYATYGTLFLIPSWNNDRYNYQVRITNQKTNRTVTSRYYEDNIEVRQFFLFYGMPFSYYSVDTMHTRVFDAVVLDTLKNK